MRAILVHADRTPGMPARLETALSLARAVQGRVSVLVDTPVARYVSLDPMTGSQMVPDAISQALEADDAQAADLQARLAGQDVPFAVLRSEDEPIDALAAAARLADVVVLSRRPGLGGDLAIATRTPVLVVPEERALAFPLDSVCIAWDGGNEAAHALRGALPLLARSRTVHLLTVAAADKDAVPAAGALAYLALHGIMAQAHALTRESSTEATLAAAVAKCGGGLLVMGAYGKSRVREYLFGGVTRHFLEDDRLPALLLAH